MPTFPTPQPIAVAIDVFGDVRISASDRVDTVVTVRPADPTKTGHVKAVEQTTVDYRDGRLVIRTPRNWRHYTPFSGDERIDVIVEVPTGSQITADLALGHLSVDGELGECRLKTAMGNVHVDQTGPLRANTGYGNLTVDRITGNAELTTGSGDLRVERIDGTAVIKDGNGDITIGEVTGDLRIKAANGDIVIGRAHTSAVAKTANGDVRIAEVRSGTVVLESAAGEISVGIREGTAAWLDVSTRFGKVRNTLGDAETPGPSESRVEVRARTSVGDILIGPPPADNTTRTSYRSDAS